MQFGYTIIYVEDVRESLAFFEQAFGLKARFIDPTGCYGELNTGATALAFAAHSLMADLLPEGYRAAREGSQPLGVEIGLFTDDVEGVYRRALACGATGLTAPRDTPWGQRVSFIRCPDGTLVEICTTTKR